MFLMSTQHKGHGSAVTPSSTARDGRRAWRLLRRDYTGVLGGLVVVAIALSFLSPYFLSAGNLLNIGSDISYIGVVAAITTIVLISGGLDLSVGAVMALSGVVTAKALSAGVPWPAAILIGLVSGGVIGLVNGVVISYVGVNPFVVTIATQFLARGTAYLVTKGQTVPVTDPTVVFIGQGRVAGIPFSLMLLAVAFCVVGWLLRRSAMGRHWFAIGGTPGGQMARLAGIPVDRRRLQTYVLSALFSAAAGVVVAGYTTSGDASALLGIELTVIGGVILGGTSLLGGRGTVIGTLVGTVLLGVINNGILLLNLGTSAQYLVQGAILLLAVIFDEVRNRRGT